MHKIILMYCACLSFATYSQQEVDRLNNRYLIKFSPAQMGLGELNFSFEHRIADKSSVELSLGPTLSELGRNSIIQEDYELYPGNYYSSNSTESGFGFFGALAYRFYALSYANAPRGLYVAPNIKYRVYNSKNSDYSNVLEDRKSSNSEFMFRINFGYQFWLTDNFAIDLFSGIGVSLEKSSKNYIYSSYDEFGNQTIDDHWTTETNSQPQITGTFGFKVGIGK